MTIEDETNFDPAGHGKTINRSPEFEALLVEYKKVIQALKIRCVNKYGVRAVDWFGL